MTKRKAFLIGFALTLAVLVPVYLIAVCVILTRSAPADTPKQGVPMRGPMPGDAKNILVMTGETGPEQFVLLRFDAPEKRIAAAALAPETVVLANGKALGLAQAAEQAGPAQAAACIRETLRIPLDHYLFCTPQQMIALTKDFSAAHLPLFQYLTRDAVRELELDLAGEQTISFTPQMFSDVMHRCRATSAARVMLRTEGYLDFLRANPDALAEDLPDAVRKAFGGLSTNLSAADLFDYERIFGFLQRETPEYQPISFPGKWISGRFELAETAQKAAAAAFGSLPDETEDTCAAPAEPDCRTEYAPAPAPHSSAPEAKIADPDAPSGLPVRPSGFAPAASPRIPRAGSL